MQQNACFGYEYYYRKVFYLPIVVYLFVLIMAEKCVGFLCVYCFTTYILICMYRNRLISLRGTHFASKEIS